MAFDPSEKHKVYEEFLRKWKRQRDVLGGEDRLKDNSVAENYLPRLSSSSQSIGERSSVSSTSTYDAYKARASFMNATARTKESLVGMI